MIENEMTVSVPLEVVKASEIEPKEVKWLWYPYIPVGKVTLLQGDPGDGKSNATRYFPQVSIIHRTCIPQRNIYDNYWNTILFSIMKIGYRYTSAGNYRSSLQWDDYRIRPLNLQKSNFTSRDTAIEALN